MRVPCMQQDIVNETIRSLISSSKSGMHVSMCCLLTEVMFRTHLNALFMHCTMWCLITCSVCMARSCTCGNLTFPNVFVFLVLVRC